MQYMPAGSLAQRLTNLGPLSVEEIQHPHDPMTLEQCPLLGGRVTLVVNY
jgi:hypothetical protein